mgnify:CR=1 FL=1|tara:strand:+ start:58906 stop:59313 length:408 start_codon:yes stop_codon:yes gene_type:complete
MINLGNVRKIIWREVQSALDPFITDFAFENIEFTPPNSTAWARTQIIPGSSTLEAISRNCARQDGTIIVDLFCADNTSPTTCHNMADALQDHFIGTDYIEGTTLLRVTNSRVSAGFLDGAYWRLPFDMAFTAYER